MAITLLRPAGKREKRNALPRSSASGSELGTEAARREGMAEKRAKRTAEGGGDLFAAADTLPDPSPDAPPVRANQEFLRFAASVLLHTDPARQAILYDLLWRMQAKPRRRGYGDMIATLLV